MPLKRKVLIAAGVVLPTLVLIPAALLSTPLMNLYLRRIDRDPDSSGSKWLLLTSADWCARTWRPEMAATRYRRFYERHAADLRRSYALLRYAQCLEEAGRNADARDIYQKYLVEYSDAEGTSEARLGINRIENCRR